MMSYNAKSCWLIAICLMANVSLLANDINRIVLNPDLPVSNQIIYPKTEYVVQDAISMNGASVEIPDDCVLLFKNGKLTDGELIGKQTQIKYDGCVFRNIQISGTWNVPKIKSSMFEDIGKENVLNNLFALSNDNVVNEIIIYPGEYPVSFAKDSDNALLLTSNTKLMLNGDIRVKPNAWDSYFVIFIRKKENVVICGSGSITGDRPSHMGKTGESGHGIRMTGSQNIVVEGITLQEFWGDGVYIGGYATSMDVILRNLDIKNCRRQGISVVNATGLVVENNEIHHIGGTKPGAGIDLEPNTGHDEVVKSITIRTNHIHDCEGAGISVYCSEENHVDSVLIEHNDIDNGLGRALTLARTYGSISIVENKLTGFFSFKNNSKAVKFISNTIICPNLKFSEVDGTGNYSLAGFSFIDNKIICQGDIRTGGRDIVWNGNEITVSGDVASLGGDGSVITDNVIHTGCPITIQGCTFSKNTVYCTVKGKDQSFVCSSAGSRIRDNQFFVEAFAPGTQLFSFFKMTASLCVNNRIANKTGNIMPVQVDYSIGKSAKVSAYGNEIDVNFRIGKRRSVPESGFAVGEKFLDPESNELVTWTKAGWVHEK